MVEVECAQLFELPARKCTACRRTVLGMVGQLKEIAVAVAGTSSVVGFGSPAWVVGGSAAVVALVLLVGAEVVVPWVAVL